jgi:FKBP-type peptidyl-prolyl cis-trans isomerase (trigger factor)
MKIKTKDSTAEIEGEVSWEKLDRYRVEVLEELRKDFTAPGFRKGNVPMDVFVKNVDEHRVLEDAAERALQETYPLLIEENDLRTLGRPEVAVTKLAAGNPLEFRVRVGLVPEVKLPNYKKIAAEVVESEPVPETTTEEMDRVIDELRALRRDKDAAPDSPLPELTDEFVKGMGNFENVEDFRKKLAENLKLEKENEKRLERREKIASALGEKTKMTLPSGVIDAEAEAMRERLAADLERAKVSMEDYMKRTKKTEGDLLKEYREYAERQLQTRFILEAIAKEENIAADPQDLAAEIHYLRQQHPQTDPETLSRYAENMLRNEKVLRFLETGGKEPAKSSEPQK